MPTPNSLDDVATNPMPGETAPLPDPSLAIHAFISSDPDAAEFLFSLFSTAAFSPRFATLLDPLPVPSRYFNAALHQPDIALLRADLLSLPSLRLLRASPASLPRPLFPLLDHIFFEPGSTTPWMRSAGASTHFPPSEVTPSRRALRFAASSTRALPSALAAGGLVTAFHGSPPERWYSILRNGLLVRAEIDSSNGRLFGDAAYLAHSFALAAAFSPHGRAGKAGAVLAMSIVGEFEVAVQAARARDVPDGYVVVEDVAAIRLTGMAVLIERRRRERGVGWVDQMARSVWGGLSSVGLLHIVVVYVVVLLLIGRR